MENPQNTKTDKHSDWLNRADSDGTLFQIPMYSQS